jgi:hypothetical protein
MALLAAAALGEGPATVLVEAERFADYGGWVNDPQFMDQMGSPFLLAHGLGRPVRDAVTGVELEQGEYRVWARTRDWVAPWKAPGAPGRFQVLVNGVPLPAAFGTEGAEWHWQAGGSVKVPNGRTVLALRDLTGFEGRCDAVLLSRDPGFTPPEGGEALAALRARGSGHPAEPEDAGHFDLVVAGGGIAGICAAVAAAREGLSVALVQDRPVLGGNNSGEVRVWLAGALGQEPYPRIGNVVLELEQARSAHYGPENTADLYEDARKEALVRAETNITLVLNARVNGAEVEGGRIVSVTAQDTRTGRRARYRAALFADCTGDGCVGALAGADFEVTAKGHMGPCNLWNVTDTGADAPFPRCPWAVDLADKPFPGRKERDIKKLGVWYWETGFDRDPIAEAERIRDQNSRAAYGAWDALKNTDGAFPTWRLNWMAHIAGARESRRLMGDVVLTQTDLVEGRVYEDGAVPSCRAIDLHRADPRYAKGFEGDEFIATADFTKYKAPYWVPYRCLYSRNVANLFMAGRDISVTHEALGAIRVMRTGGCMGEVVGLAAALCKRHSVPPRAIYEWHLDDLKASLKRGVAPNPAFVRKTGDGAPALKATPGNVAGKAAVTADGRTDGAAKLTDGKIDLGDNAGRWLSAKGDRHEVLLVWDAPVTLKGVRLVSGYTSGGKTADAAGAFTVATRLGGGAWSTLAEVKGNDAVDRRVDFLPTAADALRVTVTETKGGIARVWEIEAY